MMCHPVAERLNALKFGIDVSMRYHRRRCLWLAGLSRLITFVVVLLGSTAASTLVGGRHETSAWLGLLVAAVSLLQLLFNLDGRARDQQDALRRFVDLKRMVLKAENPTHDQIAEWESQRLAIEGDMVEELRALNVDCHNRTLVAWGQPELQVEIGWCQRRLLQICSFQHDFTTPKASSTHSPAPEAP